MFQTSNQYNIFEILCWVDFPIVLTCFDQTFGNFHWWIIRFPHAAAIFGILSIFRQTRNLQAVDDRENQNHVSMLSYYILIYLNIWLFDCAKKQIASGGFGGLGGKQRINLKKRNSKSRVPNEFCQLLCHLQASHSGGAKSQAIDVEKI